MRAALRNILFGAPQIPYLLRDEFTTDAAAPLVSPRTCEPGPGTLTLVQTDGQFSIVSGKLMFPAQATPTTSDQGFTAGGLARTAGRALMLTANLAVQTNGPVIGWHKAADINWASANGPDGRAAFYFQSDISTVASGNAQTNTGAVFSTATDYQLALVLRATGCFALIKGGAFVNWTLLWIDAAGVAATLYPTFTNYTGVGTLDSFRVVDLPAPWSTDYGIADQRLAGARSAGDTFTHSANGLIEFTATNIGGGNTSEILFRMQDASNNWDVVAHSSSDFQLYEQVAGVYTQRATAAGVLANGHRCVVVFDGATIRGYSNNVLRWTYSSATNFQTATSGKVLSLATGGGSISDIVAWPRNPSMPAGY
jgi:hypothetical protein